MDSKETALVVSGGGSKGAFSVGAIEVIRERGHDYDLIAGTSTGSLISPLAALDDLDELVTQYTTTHKRNVLTPNWRHLFVDAIYSTRPLQDRIERSLFGEPFGDYTSRYDALMASKRRIFICTVNLQTGAADYFSQTSGPSVQAFEGKKGLLAAMLASSHEPIFMPPLEVPPHNNQHLDGGLREIAPLNRVLEQGAKRVFAVVSSPENPAPSTDRYTNLLEIGIRTIDLMTDEIVLNDVKRATRYNAALKYIAEVRGRVKDRFAVDESDMQELFADAEAHFFSDKAPLDLVIVRPQTKLPADGLDFDPETMQKMRMLGQEAAKRALDARGL